MKLRFYKKGKCPVCHEKDVDLYGVEVKKNGKTKFIGVCELCLRGGFLGDKFSEDEIDNAFVYEDEIQRLDIFC